MVNPLVLEIVSCKFNALSELLEHILMPKALIQL